MFAPYIFGSPHNDNAEKLPHDPPHKAFCFSSRPIWILVPLWGLIIALAVVSTPKRAQAGERVMQPEFGIGEQGNNPQPAAADIYVKFEGVDGESKDSKKRTGPNIGSSGDDSVRPPTRNAAAYMKIKGVDGESEDGKPTPGGHNNIGSSGDDGVNPKPTSAAVFVKIKGIDGESEDTSTSDGGKNIGSSGDDGVDGAMAMPQELAGEAPDGREEGSTSPLMPDADLLPDLAGGAGVGVQPIPADGATR